MSSVETPCVKVCVVHSQSGLCWGCGRSLVEIEHWVRYDAAERDRIMAELPQRLASLGLRARAIHRNSDPKD